MKLTSLVATQYYMYYYSVTATARDYKFIYLHGISYGFPMVIRDLGRMDRYTELASHLAGAIA